MTKFCEYCWEETEHEYVYNPPSYWIPALLTVVTFGFFIPFYILYMLFTWGDCTEAKLTCSQCGNKND